MDISFDVHFKEKDVLLKEREELQNEEIDIQESFEDLALQIVEEQSSDDEQIISDKLAFQYTIETKVTPQLCFGSKLERSTNPIGKNLSSFQRKFAPEVFPNVCPTKYQSERDSALYQQLNKVRSKKGVGNLVSKVPRFPEKVYMRSPGPKYDLPNLWPKQKEFKTAFGTKAKRVLFKIDDHPGPGAYTINSAFCRRSKFSFNFGKPIPINAVEEICVPVPTDTCSKCEKICEGVYWHLDYQVYLCHLCWEEERLTKEIYNEDKLKAFKRIRNCSYRHNHEGTFAAEHVMTKTQAKKKIRLENYLDLYIKC